MMEERSSPGDAVRRLLEAAGVIVLHAGDEIASLGTANKLIAVESGMACLCTYTSAGIRRITAFHFPGEFCNLHRDSSAGAADDSRIAALTECSFRVFPAAQLQERLATCASLRVALLAAALREIRIAQEWLRTLPRPAGQRVAHLLCELFDRQQAACITAAVIPLTQLDLADATGLSAVHINRTIQELRSVGVLADHHHLEVADRKRLGEICGFDGRYLNVGSPLATAHRPSPRMPR